MINKLYKIDISGEGTENLTYHDRCCLLNSYPVLVARHFQYRVEVFFKEIVVDVPLGETKYNTTCIEFKIFASPQV